MMKIVLVAAILVVGAHSAEVVSVAGGVTNPLGAAVDTVAQTAQSLVGGNKVVTVNANLCSPWVGLKALYTSLGIFPVPGTYYCSCPTGLFVPPVNGVPYVGVPTAVGAP
uniref:Uncharacterized protein LOC114324899 n=1 Tax=Diabrotica virgifera virgifera TaxID=50390 RepID=A0A6P7F575_DIAVI